MGNITEIAGGNGAGSELFKPGYLTAAQNSGKSSNICTSHFKCGYDLVVEKFTNHGNTEEK